MLARWNPWQDVFDLQREMSELLRRDFAGPRGSTPWREGWGGSMGAWVPAVDVFSREGDLVVRAELPGINPEKDVDISVQDGVLTLRGERRHEQRSNGDSYFRVESSYGSFQRNILLPEGVKAEDIQASYQNGILEVVVPKAAELTSAKKVPITVGGDRQALTTEGHKQDAKQQAPQPANQA